MFSNRFVVAPTVALAVFVVGSMTASQLHAQQRTVEQARWLEGCWELQAGNRKVVERWEAPANGVMRGSSQTIVGGQPRGNEQLRLFMRADTLLYEAIPSGQQLTEFAARSVSPRELVFENPAHDFPQRIVYTRVGEDSVVARIEGDRGGQRRSIPFPFRKVSCTP